MVEQNGNDWAERGSQEPNLGEWDDIKIFRDPVHQYIEIPKAYVRYLIDTYEMQRIKDVAQSGLRSVYNAATHDRFSHSMGVYHLGRKAFQSLKKNVWNIIEKEKYQYKSGKEQPIIDILTHGTQEKRKVREELKLWEILFHTACILHDIGHPAMSHTLEFLYDDIYADIGCGESGGERVDSPAMISIEEYRRFLIRRREYMSAEDGAVPNRFKICLSKKLLGKESGKINGNPHERMSAYYILDGVELKDGKVTGFSSLADNIVRMIDSFRKSRGREQASKEESFEYLRFICRMIIGEPYQVPRDEEKAEERILNSAKNAIISLLNGKIDADSLDYIARNSYSAGYDTNNIDVNRLCNAYSVRFQDNQFVSVFEKNALSVLEGFVSARNFEPSWLYSHHKIVYNIDVLYKHMYKCAVKILYGNDLEKWSKLLMENFYGEGEVFDSRHIPGDKEDMEKPSAKKVSEAQISALSIRLADMYVGSESSVYERLIELKVGDLDEKTSNGAEHLLDEIKGSSAADNRDREEWKERVTPWVSGRKQLLNMVDDLWKFIEKKRDFDDALVVIMKKEDKDILESSLKEVMVQARCCLALLAEGDEGCWKEVRDKKDGFYEFLKALSQRYGELEDIENLYFAYILSPVRCFKNDRFLFYRSNDSDIDALFKQLYFGLKVKKAEAREKLSEAECRYLGLAQEYFERRYKSSLWKSYQEYEIFLDEIAENVSMDAAKINERFLALVKNGGRKIDFQSDGSANGGAEEQRIFEYNGEEEVKAAKEESAVIKFQEVFSVLRDTDFVIRIHTVKYKDFRDSVKIAFKEKVFPLGEVIDLPDACSKEFPYIFLNLAEKDGETKGEARRRYMERLRKKLEEYCVETLQAKLIVKKEDAGDIMTGGKVFRDVVHGDISIPRKFMGLIETSAFQRLRRIKQLSTADMVFPNAVHTRFAHCIGTFYVMTLIVEHFKDIFNMLGVPYIEEDVDALLAAALLHDIGHGPYSHNFERMAGNLKKHEEWSIEIIERNPEIKNALKSGFPDYDTDDFISRIKSYIMDETQEGDVKHLSFHTIFKSLISSQLDADRLDYLLRDSFNTGIGYGKIDAYSIIRGMRVTEYRNRFYVCIAENAVSYIEQFLFGRYKMYDSVYYNAYKVFSETLVLKILEYVKKKASSTKNLLDDTMTALLKNELSLDDYLTLDDSYVNGLLGRWQNDPDAKLSSMCKALFQRKGYERLYIMNQGVADIYHFKQELTEIFRIHFPELKLELEHLDSFIFAERQFTAYRYVPMDEIDAGKVASKIWVLTNDGLLKDFAEVSPMFSSDNKKNWETYKSFVYYNRELLDAELESMKKAEEEVAESISKKGEGKNAEGSFGNRKNMLLADIDQLIWNSNLRNHIEIEEKYSCRLAELDAVQQLLDAPDSPLKKDYTVSPVREIEQVDTYYDTEDLRIAKKKCSFRCRKKLDDVYKITIKVPTPNSGFDKESQVARFEYEREIHSSNLEEAFDFIRNTLKRDFPDIVAGLTMENINKVFKPQLQVVNNRSKYLVSDPMAEKEGFRFTVCLDRVKFIHGEEERQDYQIEVELESDYIHRVSMKFFTEEIEERLEKPVRHEQFSKYVKGLEVLGLYHPER